MSVKRGGRSRIAGLLFFALILVLPSIAGADTIVSVPSPQDGAGYRQPIYLHLAAGSFDPITRARPENLPDRLMLPRYTDAGPDYYLVQFDGPITQARKEALAGQVAGVFDYLPDFAFVVKMDRQALERVQGMPGVRWAGLYQPAFRVAPSLLNQLAQDSELGGQGELNLSTFPGEIDAIAAHLAAMGVEVLGRSESAYRGVLRIRAGAAEVDAIAALKGVRWIEAAPQWQLFNDRATDLMDGRDVWNTHGLRGAGQTVAVTDTGLDQGSTVPANLHDDFEDGSGSSRVVALFDRVGDGANDVLSGHGTHVAGSVLGNGLRSGSTPSTHTYPPTAHAGLAPEAHLVFQAVENNSSGDLSGIPWDLNVLFSQADQAGADIHTNSWGAPANGDYTTDSESVDEYMWDHPDFTVLFAAGNEGIDANSDGIVDLGSVASPATAKNAITIGASENNRPTVSTATYGQAWPSDFPANPIRDDRLADDPVGIAAFSGRGPTLDGRYKPDLVAPGTFIASVRSSQAAPDENWGLINNDYVYMGGTSMATPLTAGATALVREFYTDQQSHTPSSALIKATMINGATSLSPGQYGTGSTQEIPASVPNNVEGWGRVDLERSLFPATPRTLEFEDDQTGLTTGQTAVFQYNVSSPAEPLRVTLVWTDYPGTPATSGALVNNLDLTVTGPAAAVYYPAGAQQRSGNELAAAQVDNVNNVEEVHVATPGAGVYTVRVQATNVPHGPQPFALVVSGAMGEEALAVTGIQPDHAFNNGTLSDATISGSGFQSGSQVHLIRNTRVITGNVTAVDTSAGRITADFDLTGAPVGQWSVRVTNPPDIVATLTDAFEVQDAALPDLAVTTSAQGGDVNPGELFTFTISIRNNGLANATGVAFTDTLPNHTTFVSLSPGCVGGTAPLVGGFACHIQGDSLAGGGSVAYALVVSVAQDAKGALVNQVVVGSDQVDADLSDNADSATIFMSELFLPFVARGWPPLPGAPVMNPISNTGGDYVVSWSAASGASTYLLQEATNAAFEGATPVYSGSGLSKSFTGKPPGTYFYRAKGINSYGSGPWSNSESVVVGTTLPDKLTSVADAYILQGYPDYNSGGESEMLAGYDEYFDPDGQIVRSLVRFDVSQIAPGTPIGQATLYLFLHSSYDYPNQSRTITVYRVGSPWSEFDVTWNKQPSIQEGYGSAAVTHGDWRWYSFDVTALVQGWVNGTWTNHGLALRGPEHSGADSSWKSFYTREHSGDAPYIQLTAAAQQNDPGANPPADSGPSENESRGVKILEKFDDQ